MGFEREQIGACTLYRGDCRNVLPLLESVDAVVTDPPFGIGFRYGAAREVTTTPTAWWQWFSSYWEQAYSLLRPGGFWAVWSSGLYHRYLWQWFGEETHVYIAAKNFVQLRPVPMNYAYDPVATGYKIGLPRLCPPSPPRSLDFWVGNTAGVISNIAAIEKGHPCPRPLDQILHIVENFTLPGGCVLDPFMGAGTTAVACAKRARFFVGVEIERSYFDIACRRVEEAYRQRDFFFQTPSLAAVQQEALFA